MQEKIAEAWRLFDIGDFEASETIYRECLEMTSEDDYDTFASVLMGLIYTQSFLEKYDEARDYARRLLEIAPNEEEKHIALHQAGMVERMAGDYDRALEWFLQEEELIRKVFPKDDMRISANLYEQGYVNLKKESLQISAEIMKEALEYAKKSEDAMCIGCAYRGLGEIMYAQGKEDQAKDYFKQAIEAFELTGDEIAVKEVGEMLEEAI